MTHNIYKSCTWIFFLCVASGCSWWGSREVSPQGKAPCLPCCGSSGVLSSMLTSLPGKVRESSTRPCPKRTLARTPSPKSSRSSSWSFSPEDIVWTKRRCLPARPTSLTKLRLVRLCLLYYWSGHEGAQACGTFIKTNAWRGSMNHDVCPPRWLQGWCCSFVLGDRKVTQVGEQHTVTCCRSIKAFGQTTC